jgi:hypothetical protein
LLETDAAFLSGRCEAQIVLSGVCRINMVILDLKILKVEIVTVFPDSRIREISGQSEQCDDFNELIQLLQREMLLIVQQIWAEGHEIKQAHVKTRKLGHHFNVHHQIDEISIGK